MDPFQCGFQRSATNYNEPVSNSSARVNYLCPCQRSREVRRNIIDLTHRESGAWSAESSRSAGRLYSPTANGLRCPSIFGGCPKTRLFSWRVGSPGSSRRAGRSEWKAVSNLSGRAGEDAEVSALPMVCAGETWGDAHILRAVSGILPERQSTFGLEKRLRATWRR